MSPPISAKWMASDEHVDMERMVRSQLQSPYRLELQLAASPSKAAKLKIATTSKELELAYPQRIEPCSVTTAAAKP